MANVTRPLLCAVPGQVVGLGSLQMFDWLIPVQFNYSRCELAVVVMGRADGNFHKF